MALRFRGLDQPCEWVYRKDSGSAPQPVDPYQQAAAQYGLSTGTAEFNAALNRPNTVNPLGSTTWNVTGYSGEPSSTPSDYGTVNPGGTPQIGLGGSGVPMTTGSVEQNPNPLSAAGLIGGAGAPGVMYPNAGAYSLGGGTSYGSGAPLYTETTQLAPQFQSLLQKGINTNGIPELSGENLTPLTNETANAVFNQQMGYLAPEEALQSEGLNSQLSAEGLMPGSAGWNNEQARLGRQQTFENTQAASGAVTAGEQELNNLYGLGSMSLQDQIAQQQAPINEFNALNGSPGATATATTPDISGAFGQQYQGQLAGYNAGVATNNANAQAGASLASMLALFALA